MPRAARGWIAIDATGYASARLPRESLSAPPSPRARVVAPRVAVRGDRVEWRTLDRHMARRPPPSRPSPRPPAAVVVAAAVVALVAVVAAVVCRRDDLTCATGTKIDKP